MKKRIKRANPRTYNLLIFLCLLLGFILVIKEFSPFSLIVSGLANDAKPKKAFANLELPSPLFVSEPSPTPSTSPLFNVASLLAATPTPTPTPAVLQNEQQPAANDFCLNVPMLMYHHVQPMDIANKLGHGQLTVDSAIFDQQMAYLVASGYKMISSEELVNALFSHQQVPAKSMVITVDDGYDDAYDYAYQTAKKYNFKIDFMIPTGLINNPGYMNWNQLKEMAGNPLVTMYNHTWSHTALGSVDKGTIVREVSEAKKQLQDNLGVNTSVLVYPYGSFNDLAIATAREQGYNAAISTIPGTLQCDSFIMELHRTRIGNASMSYYGF